MSGKGAILLLELNHIAEGHKLQLQWTHMKVMWVLFDTAQADVGQKQQQTSEQSIKCPCTHSPAERTCWTRGLTVAKWDCEPT